jgi:hypothetical protein
LLCPINALAGNYDLTSDKPTYQDLDSVCGNIFLIAESNHFEMTSRDGVIRLRGAVILAISVPFWLYCVWFHETVMSSPYAYEMGSLGVPFPPQFRAAAGGAVICTVAGTLLLVVDFIRRVINRSWRRKYNR